LLPLQQDRIRRLASHNRLRDVGLTCDNKSREDPVQPWGYGVHHQIQ
jgi:hypothetical protein